MIRELKISLDLVKTMNFATYTAFSILEHRYLIMGYTLGVTYYFLLLWTIFNKLYCTIVSLAVSEVYE